MTDAGFDAHGCGAATAAGSAAVTLVRGGSVLDAARIGAAQIAAELGGLSPGKLHAAEVAADALARALGAAVRDRARLSPPDGPARRRTLVAMSGGVDSSVAALLCAREGETVAVTLELWSDTRERRRAQLLLVLGGRAGARRSRTRWASRTSRSICATSSAPAWSSRSSPRSPPARPRTRASAATATSASTRCWTSPTRLGCERLATGHYARVAESDDDAGPLLRVAADRRQGSDLHARRALAGVAGADAVPARGADQARGQADRRGGRAAGREQGRLPGSVLPRRNHPAPGSWPATAGSDDAGGSIVDGDGNVVGRHDGQHRFTVGQRRGLGIAAGEPLYVLDKDAARNEVIVGPRSSLAHHARSRPRRAASPRRRPRRPGQAALPVATARVPRRRAGEPRRARAGHAALELELAEAVDGAAPGQLACLMDGDLVVGWGTIARRGKARAVEPGASAS